MAWRDRDWAKPDDSERQAFHGRGTTRTAGRSGRGLLLALGVSLGLVTVLGQIPRHHPLIPTFSLHLPPETTQPNATIKTLAASYASTYTLTGTTRGDGPVEVDGSWNNGPWQHLAGGTASADSYVIRFPITDHGSLKLRVRYPGGEADGSVLVP